MLFKKLINIAFSRFVHAQEAMALYGAMNYGSAPIITPLAPTPSSDWGKRSAKSDAIEPLLMEIKDESKI